MRIRFFTWIARLSSAHPKKVVVLGGLFAIISMLLAVTNISLNSNLDELVSEKLDYHKRYIEFLKEFGDEEYLYVVVDASDDLPSSKKFMEALGTKIKNLPDIKQVIWKIENQALERNFLLYLTPSQLSVLSKMTTQGPFSVKNIASWDGFAPMFGALASRISGPVSPADEAELATGFTFMDGLIDDMTNALERDATYRSRLQALFFGDGDTFDPDGFLKNGSLLFILIMPLKDYSTTAVIARPLEEIRRAIATTKAEFPGIDAGLTGRPALAADEIATSSRDMTIATIIALSLVSIIFISFFKCLGRPFCAVISLVMGISWTFGFVAIAFGTLNILSNVFALLLIGAAIEYSVYIVARYEEELAKTGDVSEAVNNALTTTGMANVTSAVTTAAAFCTLIWTDFTALAQLGIIAAVGIIFCLVAMLFVLPSLLVMGDSRKSVSSLRKTRSFAFPKIVQLYKRPSVVFAFAILAVVGLMIFVPRVGFDNNLLNLQAKGLESVKYEHLIIEKSSETTWFARATADTVAESHRKAEEFRKLESVRRVDDIERIVPEGQDAKIAMVKDMAPAFEGLKFREVGDSIDARMLMFELGRLASSLDRLEEEAFSSGRPDAVEELGRFKEKVEGLVLGIGMADENSLLSLGRMQSLFFDDLHKNLNILSSGMNPSKISIKDLPSDLSGRFVSPQGRYSLMIYPKENIWDPPRLAKFVDEIRGVDPQVIGTPIEVHESARIMRKTFARSGVLAFVLICVIVWFDFRSKRAMVTALTPLVAGLLCLFGTMGLIGLKFNMANFFAIPILIGTGVDFGVQLTHRLRRERGFKALGTSTGKGLIMTALANGAGFGSMMIAHHLGLKSLGEILVIGCAFCLIAAFFVAAPLGKWLDWGSKI